MFDLLRLGLKKEQTVESLIGLVKSLETSGSQFVPQLFLVHVLPDVLPGVNPLGHQAPVHCNLENLHRWEGQLVSLGCGRFADELPRGDVLRPEAGLGLGVAPSYQRNQSATLLEVLMDQRNQIGVDLEEQPIG